MQMEPKLLGYFSLGVYLTGILCANLLGFERKRNWAIRLSCCWPKEEGRWRLRQFSCTTDTAAVTVESGSQPGNLAVGYQKIMGWGGTTAVHPIPSSVHRPDPHIASCAVCKPDARTQQQNWWIATFSRSCQLETDGDAGVG